MWLTYGNEYTLKMREKPVAVTNKLKNLNWNMSL